MSLLKNKSPTIWQWLRKNLFNNWYNSILTVVCLWVLVWAIKSILTWVLTQAKWAVIQANFSLFFVGRFPQELYWRLWLALVIILGLTGLSWGAIAKRFPSRFNTWLPLGWALSFPIILWLIGGGLGLQPVESGLWNGLLLTILTAAVSIFISFPLGILLALGRQSQLFFVRWFSILYIELIRGLPLIGILFLAQVMIPLFLPPEIRLDRVLRGMAGLTLFSAAYLAENVRGGLQSIPRGQFEAARSLGFNTPLTMLLIVLPQALRAVIPALVGQFIGLFKDTSLLAIVGLLELTGIARSILAQPQFLDRYAEVYLFIGFIYWIFCYSMSLASRRLENQ
ncbi:amino acid ABC transporter permease [Scytonema hofmannii PCC 7110]|uniref:Amino acid ABC transporter permease n=1 Tax=Scytonema hofmannii PCC 7110 TaxID=128403 RepID=A0A139WWH6_9CYAN|nr:amino acid ABC transporter permease [Scytonema hofmannii]KYC36763.1 amino acid ABC transporter permease [Scytonema hofmannii PCC 7110]